jgi:hypothetical protein
MRNYLSINNFDKKGITSCDIMFLSATALLSTLIIINYIFCISIF